MTESPINPQYAMRGAMRNYRRALVVALVLGAVSLLVAAVTGHVVVGILLCLGLGLGVYNNHLLARSAVELMADGTPSKGRMAASVLRRLALITAIALAIAFVYRPQGLAVLGGLAAFQLLSVGSVFGNLYRGVRRA
ncbi:MAG: ATP synthase subunit I [Frankiaceae bacterium]